MTFKTRKLHTNAYPFVVEPDATLKSYTELIRWCHDTFGAEASMAGSSQRWLREFYCIRFQNEADRNWFLLKWT